MEVLIAALLFAALGLGVGFMLGRSSAGSSSVAMRERADNLAARVRELNDEQVTLHDQLVDARQQAAVADAHLGNDQRLLSEFERLSRATLAATSKDLVKAAEASFELAQQKAQGDREQERLRIQHLVQPVQENLSKLEAHIQKSEKERKEEYGGLFQQMRGVAESSSKVQQEAAALKNVLRSSSSTRGRWGEVQLRRVVELAGMLEHSDFTEQTTVTDEEGMVRADLVVYLPGPMKIAVDSKVPYGAYEQAQSTDDPVAQKRLLADHAKAFRSHVDSLAKRAYWDRYLPSAGFTVLFVPGEALLDSALSQDPNLWEQAAERHILLATPSTLIALLRMASLGWRQQAQADNAVEITRVGKELHKRLMKACGDVEKMGRSMRSAMASYNGFVATLDTRVLPQARRLSNLGAGDTSATPLVSLVELDELPRSLNGSATESDEGDEATLFDEAELIAAANES